MDLETVLSPILVGAVGPVVTEELETGFGAAGCSVLSDLKPSA
jgi:hypothetical protein